MHNWSLYYVSSKLIVKIKHGCHRDNICKVNTVIKNLEHSLVKLDYCKKYNKKWRIEDFFKFGVKGFVFKMN